MTIEPFNPKVDSLVNESRKILNDPNRVFELAKTRLFFLATELLDHFNKPENTFRIAVIGDTNLGKTTFAYSVFNILRNHCSFPAYYIDLDLHTESGSAISGKIKWEERRKRTQKEIPPQKIHDSINLFAKSGPGITLGDFPGRIDNPSQIERLNQANLALIFALDKGGKDQWARLCTKAGIGYRWVISRTTPSLENPIYPQITGLRRRVIFDTEITTSVTSILEEAAEMTGAPKSVYENIFTQAELVVLQEYLDFLFSIRMP